MNALIKIVELVDAAKTFLFLLFIGFFIAAGMRIGQWVIPAPQEKVQLLVCLAEGSELVGNCKYLDDFMESAE